MPSFEMTLGIVEQWSENGQTGLFQAQNQARTVMIKQKCSQKYDTPCRQAVVVWDDVRPCRVESVSSAPKSCPG